MTTFTRFLKIGSRLALFVFLAVILGVAALLTSMAILRRQPLQLPAPTGPYQVGRVEVDWIDQTRNDALADNPTQKRELPVWIWYPAQVGPSAQPAFYLPAIWAAARASDKGIGILLENDLILIKTHSFAGVPLAGQGTKYPLLMLQPGMGPVIPDYTVLAENLASHGYVVVGINPTDTSSLVGFADGHIRYRSTQGTIPDSASPAEADQIANRIMAVWAKDVAFGMDQMERINANPVSPFYQRLDLQQIGVFGHSFGGATALAVCQSDARCKAGADLDGTPFSAEAKTSIPRPFLFMTEDYSQGCDSNCAAIRQMGGLDAGGNVQILSVSGAKHFNFSDLAVRQLPMIRFVFQAAGFTGTIRPERGEEIVNAYLLAFFDHVLKGSAAGLLQGPSSAYPEVRFER